MSEQKPMLIWEYLQTLNDQERRAAVHYLLGFVLTSVPRDEQELAVKAARSFLSSNRGDQVGVS